MKEAFEVAEEGFDVRDDEENENLMRQFVDYIKNAKVVNMDELGAHFKLRTEEAIDRLNYFIENGTLTGVIDDRGKFIYITEEELQAGSLFPVLFVTSITILPDIRCSVTETFPHFLRFYMRVLLALFRFYTRRVRC
ncbi:unnamed protein product [Toxocara canis]|uniref:DDRGK domain-containing protein 1 n=1 Tax=Toxocara canis TaxID=6265 RepID=A0A183U8M0_TOXCA|nr:unnamed protein product [Toxocara canis]